VGLLPLFYLEIVLENNPQWDFKNNTSNFLAQVARYEKDFDKKYQRLEVLISFTADN
jgi:hypothetical protein